MANRTWQYKETDVKTISPELIAAANDLPILAKLLAIRGLSDPEEVKAFLNPADYQPTDGLEFPDMEKAVERVLAAIHKQEPILVYGDFDVDGITGTSVLMQGLTHLKAKVSYYVPDRHAEGHGLNSASLCRLVSARQVKLVITTDTGSSNFNEVQLLKSLGVDTIITDHHELPENLPQALAILNPKLLPESSAFTHLCGAGVAYKLCEGLFKKEGVSQKVQDSLLDLVAIGTVVDMVPLLRENRYLVWRGLQVLEQRERLGLQAILLEAGVPETAPINAQTLGFMIGPRLNAIGRLSTAEDAVELMLTDDAEKARQLAAKLEQLNRRRKELVEQCLLQAESHLLSTGELTDQKAVILCSQDWNQGIVGLVATKLVEKYQRPSFVGYIDEASQEVRFSARSIERFNMHENLQALEDLFIRWGGHSGAAGFAISQDNLQKLKTRLFALCHERIQEADMTPITSVDMKLTSSQVNPFLVEIVDRMAPFGQGNPLPVFALEQMSIGAQRRMGEDQRHLKLILTNNEPGQYLEAIQWNSGQTKLEPKSKYRFAFTVEINTYNGSKKIQLLLKDLQDESQASQSALKPVPVRSAEKGPVQTIAHVSKPAAVLSTAASEEATLFQWIDHRGRDEVESFLSQTLLASNGQSGYRIFCEGTQHFLPLPLSESLFCKRHENAQAEGDNLILWDLPPDMKSLIKLLKLQKPKTIHLIGGKYQKIPIYRAAQAYLEGLYKTLLRQWKPEASEPWVIRLSDLTIGLSTTHRVIITGISLLHRLDVLTTTVLEDKDSVRIEQFDSETELASIPLENLVEYMAFQAALDEVHHFREWLMTTPLAAIQSAVLLEVQSGTSVLVEERERHAAINVRKSYSGSYS